MSDEDGDNSQAPEPHTVYTAPGDIADKLLWAAAEIRRLNAIISADSHKTHLIDSNGARDYRVRNRAWGVIARHVNRQHEDLSDHDLAMAAFREYSKHVGRSLIDPNE